MAELLCVEGSSRVESDVPRAVTSAHSESKPHCCSSGRTEHGRRVLRGTWWTSSDGIT